MSNNALPFIIAATRWCLMMVVEAHKEKRDTEITSKIIGKNTNLTGGVMAMIYTEVMEIKTQGVVRDAIIKMMNMMVGGITGKEKILMGGMTGIKRKVVGRMIGRKRKRKVMGGMTGIGERVGMVAGVARITERGEMTGITERRLLILIDWTREMDLVGIRIGEI